MASTARQRWLALTPKERARIVHQMSSGGATTDGLAHGKPIVRNAGAVDRDELKIAMQAPWDGYLDPDTVEVLYGQVIELRKVLFAAAKIRWADSLTSAVGSN